VNTIVASETIITHAAAERATVRFIFFLREQKGLMRSSLNVACWFEKTIQHLGTFQAPRRKLFVNLLSHFPELMQFIGDIQRGKNGDFARIDGQSPGRNFAHAPVDVFG
jgi:hypothetical protein